MLKVIATSEDIRSQKDPYLREILALGYDKVFRDERSRTLMLLHHNGGLKEFEIRDIEFFIYKLTIKTAVLIDGRFHSWLSDADGSADKFREFIGVPKQAPQSPQE